MGESILLNFTIGLFIGGIVGVMSMAIISARRITDMEQSVMESRAQIIAIDITPTIPPMNNPIVKLSKIDSPIFLLL
jgi:hypothetical protein